MRWIDIAKLELGTAEIPGPKSNLRINDYLKSCAGLPAGMIADETAWCSAFVNWTMKECGYRHTDDAMARSWLGWGVPLSSFKSGCVCVFKRLGGSPSQGHVGFGIEKKLGWILVLGGNQDNQVCMKWYPEALLLGMRWPTEAKAELSDKPIAAPVMPPPKQSPEPIKPSPALPPLVAPSLFKQIANWFKGLFS